MNPIQPEARAGAQVVTFAKDQPEYLPLIANIKGPYVETKWSLTWKERWQVLRHGTLYLTLMTFGKPLQPIRMSILRDEYLEGEPLPECRLTWWERIWTAPRRIYRRVRGLGIYGLIPKSQRSWPYKLGHDAITGKPVAGEDLTAEDFNRVERDKPEPWDLPIHTKTHALRSLRIVDASPNLPEAEKQKARAAIFARWPELNPADKKATA